MEFDSNFFLDCLRGYFVDFPVQELIGIHEKGRFELAVYFVAKQGRSRRFRGKSTFLYMNVGGNLRWVLLEAALMNQRGEVVYSFDHILKIY